jgi:MFS family permease
MGLVGFAPLLFQTAMDYSATESGFLVLPFTYSWLVGSVFSVKFILKRDYKKPLLAGFFATFSGLLLFQIFFFNLSTLLIVICMTLMGLGMAFNYPIVMIVTQYDVPKTQTGFATSAVFWIRNLGSTIGTGIMGLVMIMTFRLRIEKLSSHENFKPFTSEIMKNPDALLNPLILQKLKSIPETHEAFFMALFWAFMGLLVMGFVSLVAAFWFPKKEIKGN